jgi:hypothetical protein
VSELDQSVRAAVRDCLGVREGEDVLVICNPATQSLGERLRAEAQAVGAGIPDAGELSEPGEATSYLPAASGGSG